MTNITKLKQEKQDEAVELFKTRNTILLTWATGVGKTLAAVKCAFSKKSKNGKWLVVCKEILHIKNFIDDMNKHGYSIEDFKFVCMASLHKEAGNVYEGIIIDEAHGIATELRLKNTQAINYEYCILLSATPRKEHIDAFKESIVKFPYVRFHIPLTEAVDMNFLPQPKFVLVDIVLDNKNRYITHTIRKGKKKDVLVVTTDYSNYIKERARLKRDNVDEYVMKVMCTEKEYYDLLTNQAEFFRKKSYYNKYFEFRYLNLYSKRKSFVAKLKTEAAKSLIDKHKNERFLVFSDTKSQANEFYLHNTEGATIIHSDYDKASIQSSVEQFNSGEKNRLIAVDMARESMNLTNIDGCIIVQIDSYEGSFLQMLGRSLRGKDPVCYLIRAVNTKDAEYVSNAISAIDNSWITTITYDPS